ncbi:hypothetical protein [Proteus mirabilis]|uniref:hypothetical protein n=1 Tax=Proteus mirabilis TaxID=584 RepID=UPI0034D45009
MSFISRLFSFNRFKSENTAEDFTTVTNDSISSYIINSEIGKRINRIEPFKRTADCRLPLSDISNLELLDALIDREISLTLKQISFEATMNGKRVYLKTDDIIRYSHSASNNVLNSISDIYISSIKTMLSDEGIIDYVSSNIIDQIVSFAQDSNREAMNINKANQFSTSTKLIDQ